MKRTVPLFPFLVITIALYSLSSAAQTPPQPPTITTINDSPPTYTATSYNLGAAIADLPFSIQLPAMPVITSEVVCTTEAEITASLAVNGRRTIIAPGTYSFGSINIGGSDKHIVFRPGVTLNLGSGSLIIDGGSRIRVDGGRGLITTNTSNYVVQARSSSDVALFDIDIRNTASPGQGIIIADYGNTMRRFALVSVDIESNTSTLYTGSPMLEDFVIANSRLFNTQTINEPNGWSMRFNGPFTRGAFLDSYFRAIANTTIRQGGSGSNADVIYLRNRIDYGNIWGYRTDHTGTITRLSLKDNEFNNIISPDGAGGFLLDDRNGGILIDAEFTGNTLNAPTQWPWFSDTTTNPVTITSSVNPPVWEMQ